MPALRFKVIVETVRSEINFDEFPKFLPEFPMCGDTIYSKKGGAYRVDKRRFIYEHEYDGWYMEIELTNLKKRRLKNG